MQKSYMSHFQILPEMISSKHFLSLSKILNQSKLHEVVKIQGYKFSDHGLNSGFHEVQILACLFIFSLFGRLLACIHTLFQAFSFRSANIPDNGPFVVQDNICILCYTKGVLIYIDL